MNSGSNIKEKELKKSLNLVILGVSFGIAFFTVVGSPIGAAPFTGFVTALGASNFLYGIIMAVPVIGSIVQVFASYFLELYGKRKPLFLVAGIIHRILWIPIGLIPILLPIGNNSKIILIIILIMISTSANSVTSVSFLSWMGALIPSDIRGRFFSKRMTVYTFTGLVSGLIATSYLGDKKDDFDKLAVVFSIAAVFGLIDIICFFWVKEPLVKVSHEKPKFFNLFLEPFSDKNYMKFVLFVTTWNFAINFSSPFFNKFMLEYLDMTYFKIFLFTNVVSNLSTIFFIRYWGKLIDKFGNKPIMTICCSVILSFPIFWMFASPSNYHIIIILQFLSGIFWPGFEMTAMNLSIWLAPEKNKSVYIANYALVTTVFGTAIAFICGGKFMDITQNYIYSLKLPFFMGQQFNNYHLLFFTTEFLRLSAFMFFLRLFNEKDSHHVKRVFEYLYNRIRR